MNNAPIHAINGRFQAVFLEETQDLIGELGLFCKIQLIERDGPGLRWIWGG